LTELVVERLPRGDFKNRGRGEFCRLETGAQRAARAVKILEGLKNKNDLAQKSGWYETFFLALVSTAVWSFRTKSTSKPEVDRQ